MQVVLKVTSVTKQPVGRSLRYLELKPVIFTLSLHNISFVLDAENLYLLFHCVTLRLTF